MKKAIRSCPKCGDQMKKILYGMPSPDVLESDEYIIAGCMLGPDAPQIGCPSCGYETQPGGRTYRTEFTKPIYKPGTEDWDEPEIIQRKIDLVTASDEEVWALSDGLFQARLELLHRGVDEKQINDRYLQEENWSFMPFKPYAEVLVYVDSATKEPLMASWFFAHESTHGFCFIQAGGEQWDTVGTTNQFHDLMLSLKREALETWHVAADDSYPAPDGPPTHLSSPAVRAVIEGKYPKFGPRDSKQERPILWPYWFESDRSFWG